MGGKRKVPVPDLARPGGDLRLEQVALRASGYRWPAEQPDVDQRVCPLCERPLNHAISCSCSQDGYLGRLALGSILRGPE